MADLNSKHLKIMFLGIFYCLKKYLTLIFKVLDQGYHFWILYKFNVYGSESILWFKKNVSV
jgi:hypothetical protein